MKTRGKIGIFLVVVGILASLAFVGTNQSTQSNQEVEKTPISVSPYIQDEPTKETVKVESKSEQVKVEPVKTEPVEEIVQSEHVQTEPVEEIVQPEHVQTEHVEEIVQPEHVQTEHVKAEPEPVPVKIESQFVCSGNAECITGKITKIVDGDTLEIDGIRIRISLTNTPESNETGFIQATKFTTSLCPMGSIAHVDQDDLQLYDDHDRMLGKVTCSGGVLNSELLYNGYANILTNYCITSEFSEEKWAQDHGCAGTNNESKDISNENVTPIPKEISEPSSDESNCDPSYPDFCIPPSPPDLDCKDVAPQKKFTVYQPDPHRFDGDKDGIGCE